MKMVLIADDERDIVNLLEYNLKKEGYSVLTASSGKEALALAQRQPHLILLDIMMPEHDGLEVLKRLRENHKTSHIPVIFLTAKGSELDEVLGLELGADDYVVKPISIPKLLARVKTVLRKQRQREEVKGTINIGSIEILPSQRLVRVNGKEMFFPKKEFDVLLYLATHLDQVVTREMLLNAVWGNDVYVIDRTVDVHVRKIREKLGKHANSIKTIKGVGYTMRE